MPIVESPLHTGVDMSCILKAFNSRLSSGTSSILCSFGQLEGARRNSFFKVIHLQESILRLGLHSAPAASQDSCTSGIVLASAFLLGPRCSEKEVLSGPEQKAAFRAQAAGDVGMCQLCLLLS